VGHKIGHSRGALGACELSGQREGCDGDISEATTCNFLFFQFSFSGYVAKRSTESSFAAAISEPFADCRKTISVCFSGGWPANLGMKAQSSQGTARNALSRALGAILAYDCSLELIVSLSGY
jgi:hypothetical protein